MRREEIADLTAFVSVAVEHNFTRAAAKLGMSQSALSQIVRRLEARLRLRLLARTTRSVTPTEAGEWLAQTLAPMLHDLDRSIVDLSELRDKPAETTRITTVEHAAKTILCPALSVRSTKPRSTASRHVSMPSRTSCGSDEVPSNTGSVQYKRMSGGGRFRCRGVREVKAEEAVPVRTSNLLYAANSFGAAKLVQVI